MEVQLDVTNTEFPANVTPVILPPKLTAIFYAGPVIKELNHSQLLNM